MPTVLRAGPYRVFFYSGDRGEPAHVHVEAGAKTAKFWLVPIMLERSNRFDGSELRLIERIVTERQAEFLEAWHDYFEG